MSDSQPDSLLAGVLAAVAEGNVSSAALLGWPPVYRAYCLGYQKAESATEIFIGELQTDLARAESDADIFYERWRNSDKHLSEVRQRRIDQALSAALADPAEQPLTAARQVQLTVEAATAPRRAA